jgi:hypothetical protein
MEVEPADGAAMAGNREAAASALEATVTLIETAAGFAR